MNNISLEFKEEISLLCALITGQTCMGDIYPRLKPEHFDSKPFGFAARPPVLLALLIVKDEAGKVKKQKFVQGNR